MSDPVGYPLVHALRQDRRWGTLNMCKSQNNEYNGWIWLVPPLKELPAGFVVNEKCDLQILKESVGYLYPSVAGSDPADTAVAVCLLADKTVIEFPKVLDEPLFRKWENVAIKTGNKGKLFNSTVPVVPARFYRTISEKHKYHYLQHNFSQVQIQNGKPSSSYLQDTPQALEFDPRSMAATTVAKPQEPFVFDVSRVFEQNFETSGVPFKDSLALGTALASKRSAPVEPVIQSPPHTPEHLSQPVATPIVQEKEKEIEQPAAKKQRKAPAKKTADPVPPKAPGNRKKTTPDPVPVPIPIPAPVIEQIQCDPVPPPPKEQPIAKMDTEKTSCAPQNKNNIIHLVRKIREDPRFNKVKTNPLEKIPDQIGQGPTSPQTKKTLLLAAQIADFYLSEEWALKSPPQDDFLDSLFSGV
jgi:hypothetical protein